MKKLLALLLGTAILLSVTACGTKEIKVTENEVQPEKSESNSRTVEFKTNKDLETYLEELQLDKNIILQADNLYLSAKKAFDNLDAKTIIEDLKDCYFELLTILFPEDAQASSELQKDVLFFRAISFAGAASAAKEFYGGIIGENELVSDKITACKILHGIDMSLSLFYENYKPIFSPPKTTAAEIINDYEKNELEAENKYSNNLFIVEGYINEITKDVYDSYYVLINDGSKYGDGIRCYFDSGFSTSIMSLKRGQRVSFILEINEKGTFDVNATLWGDSTDFLNHDDFSDWESYKIWKQIINYE